MPRFTSYDDTSLAYRVLGDGEPLLCLPGGAGRAGSYLGTLGGLDRHRALVVLDNRGTGDSDVPADPATYRRDRLADDVEALRVHLGLERIDLLGHSAGAGIAFAYAAGHPDRVRSLVLLTPALRSVGLSPTPRDWDHHVEAHRAEPWYATAKAGLETVFGGADDMAARIAMAPLFYGHWDDEAAAHAAAEETDRAPAASAGYWADGAPDPDATRAALAALTAPVLVHAGGADPVSPPALCRALADLIPGATYVEQPGAGHFPWVDDPAALVDLVTTWKDWGR